MKQKLLIANHMLLFLCASMYLGTGGSMILFSFPVVPQLTPDNYYLQFVPQVQAATDFFTNVVKVMLACCAVMLIAEWRQRTRWVPIVAMLCVISASALTMIEIFPLNERMAQHIEDQDELNRVFEQWMRLSRIRMVFWCAQWAALAWYFSEWAWRGRYEQTAATVRPAG